MRKRMILVGIAVAVSLVFVVPSVLAGEGAYRGEASDSRFPQMGTIKYLSNPAGYHLWFTVSESFSLYKENHSYHQVYQLRVDNPDEWCGTVTVGSGGREPYTLVGHQGETAYYKIIDTTTDTQVCP